MTTYYALWIGWIAYFAIVEYAAIRHTPHGVGTFSHRVWAWFAVRDLPDDRRRLVVLRRLVLLGTLAWLFAHFVSGGRFP